MQICDQLTSDRPLALALGGFDGIHIGHVQVLRAVQTDPALTPAVFTFRDLIPAVKHTRQLTSARQQYAQLAELGIARLYLADFASLRDLTPEAFVRDILHRRLHARRVSCGFNYRFGCRGAGDSDALMRLCARYGIETAVAEPVTTATFPSNEKRSINMVFPPNRAVLFDLCHWYDVHVGEFLIFTSHGPDEVVAAGPDAKVHLPGGRDDRLFVPDDNVAAFLRFSDHFDIEIVLRDFIVHETFHPAFMGVGGQGVPYAARLDRVDPHHELTAFDAVLVDVFFDDPFAGPFFRAAGIV